jgi:hypothetical protein
VIGTATSGQAAQNLGREAELGESARLASLIWRLEHGRLRLDDRSVVLCDEVGMTDDVDLVRLGRPRRGGRGETGAHRRSPPAGRGRPGRRPASPRRPPPRRGALPDGEPPPTRPRRAGRPGRAARRRRRRAVSWYETHGRIHAIDRPATTPYRPRWTPGPPTSPPAPGRLFAWRRANVAALNQRAREWMEPPAGCRAPRWSVRAGWPTGPATGSSPSPPDPDGSLVTSQRATVEAVDPRRRALMLRTDDGRLVRLAGEEAGAERLGYGYATTVHRSQGATVARAHLFADGGGRELAYVAMSRARKSTHIWAVADDLAQAVEDLRRDWTIRRSPTWAIDTGQPIQTEQPRAGRLPSVESQVRQVAVSRAQAQIAVAALEKVRRPALEEAVEEAGMDLQRAKEARADLDTGDGVYHQTDAGRAVRDLHVAQAAAERARWEAEHAPRWRERRTAAKQAATWAERQPTPSTGSRCTWRPKPPAWTPTSSGARRPSLRSSPGPKSNKSPTGRHRHDDRTQP